MSFYIIIAIAVAGLLLGITAICVTKWQLRERREERQILAELDALEQLMTAASVGDASARQRLMNNESSYIHLARYSSDSGPRDQLTTLLRTIPIEKQFSERSAAITKILDQQSQIADDGYLALIDTGIRLVGLFRGLLGGNDEAIAEATGVSEQIAKDRLKETVARYSGVLATTAGDDYGVFELLRQLITRTHDRLDYLFKVGVCRLSYPEEWNTWVAEYYPEPALGDFDIGHQRVPGELLIRAAAAVRDPDIVEAKIILAYAAPPTAEVAREEIAPFAAQLASMVVAYNVKHELTGI